MNYSILVQQDYSEQFVKLSNSFDSIDECIEEVKIFTKEHYKDHVSDNFEYSIVKQDQHQIIDYVVNNSFFMMDLEQQNFIKSQQVVCVVEIKDFDESNMYLIIQN